MLSSLSVRRKCIIILHSKGSGLSTLTRRYTKSTLPINVATWMVNRWRTKKKQLRIKQGSREKDMQCYQTTKEKNVQNYEQHKKSSKCNFAFATRHMSQVVKEINMAYKKQPRWQKQRNGRSILIQVRLRYRQEEAPNAHSFSSFLCYCFLRLSECACVCSVFP